MRVFAHNQASPREGASAKDRACSGRHPQVGGTPTAGRLETMGHGSCERHSKVHHQGHKQGRVERAEISEKKEVMIYKRGEVCWYKFTGQRKAHSRVHALV